MQSFLCNPIHLKSSVAGHLILIFRCENNLVLGFCYITFMVDQLADFILVWIPDVMFKFCQLFFYNKLHHRRLQNQYQTY